MVLTRDTIVIELIENNNDVHTMSASARVRAAPLSANVPLRTILHHDLTNKYRLSPLDRATVFVTRSTRCKQRWTLNLMTL